MLKKSFNGHKICEALSDPTRTQIFKQLIQVYPKAQTITEIEKVLPKHVSATTVSFHLKKLREAGLITTNGHKKGFRATRKMLIIDFNNNGFHIKEE
ncbi:MAG: helix-turn-helix domain-containing protein [Candidatus Bathyarchaeia archaeon]|nr:helix-turn-helix domain-containing protein [Candidatus Bathyarchaeia archaeon]MDI6904789.1 helix-turn-helix domain-containing protein [Candidatus Bathyarchaeia archaeon]